MSTLAEHIAAEEAELHPPSEPPASPPPPASAPPPVVEPPKEEPPPADNTPEAEADSTKPDAELSEAGRTMRASRLDERKKRIEAEVADLQAKIRERNDLRRQLATETPTPAGDRAGTPAPGTAFSFPTFDAWQTETGNAEKSYDDYTDARTDARFAFNEARSRAASERAESARAVHEAVRTFDERARPYREQYSDFDALVSDLVLTPPMQTAAFRDADGPAIVYHLAKHAADYARIAQLPPAEQLIELGTIRAALVAARTKPAATKPLTSAPPPPSQTVGSSASPATVDTTKIGTSARDHYRIEQAEIDERRRAGYRY